MDVYSIAAGGECAASGPGDTLRSTCGGSRFGCWTCTVVRRDKAGEGLAEKDSNYELLLEYRNWLAKIRYQKSRRWAKRRNGQPGPGPLTFATRREALKRLLDLCKVTG